VLLRTALAFPLYVLISAALVAAGFLMSVTYDYNMRNDTLQFAAVVLILLGPVLCGVVQYAIGRKWSSSALSLWGGVAIATFLAPLVAIGCMLLLVR